MTPERWKRTEELYHAAHGLLPGERAAFLAELCPDDAALRSEVESLLNESASDDGFLVEPALAMPVHMVSDLTPGIMIDRTLGGYHLQALLGAGGMGEVYRARDAKLGREVAIKILPSAFTSHPDRLARFEREARMLASLNHPNICAIYGLEEADGVRFLILELVEGETLADRLADSRLRSGAGGLPLRDALTIARQIAEALEVAHEKGIIHRDLKPANIKITPDGVVKVLDFGLAKAVGGDGSSPDLTHGGAATRGEPRVGAVIGTAAYMSPEQARGLTVDKRTDIWAFGCVLYEMLSGRVAFAGDTVSDSIAKILEREPDWSVLPAATPAAVQRLLFRCLAKDPKKRVRDIGDVRIEIDAIDEVLPGASRVAHPATTKALTKWLSWAALVALAAGVGIREAGRPATTKDAPLANARFTQFTTWEGTEGGAEISPDGRFVAFLADHDGEFDIWWSQVGTGIFKNLTSDYPPLDAPRSDSLLRTFGFSGDGSEIWFSLSGDAGGPKMLMPLTGGSTRPFLGDGDATPSWSPDGAHLVHLNNKDGDPLFLADGKGADARPILLDQQKSSRAFFGHAMHNHNPVWSPDNQWIYLVHGLDPTDEMEMSRLRPSGGSPEQLTPPQASMNFPAPLNSSTLLYVARAQDRSGPWLWSLDVESKATRRVISGLEQYTSVAASRDGRRVVVTSARPTASLWRVPLLDRQATDADVQAVQLPTSRALAPRFGGTSLFYLSAKGTGDGLWRFQDGNTFEVLKGASLAEPPAVSPDGRRVAVIIRQAGRRHLAIMSADGTGARRLAPSINIQGTADWSPDGKWIATGGSDVDGPGLFNIPVDGGAPVKLVDGKWNSPVWSPNGNLIVYAGPIRAGHVPLLGVRPDRTPVDLPPLRVSPGGYRFLPDGTGLVYLPRRTSLDFWLINLATKHSRQLTHLSNLGSLRTFDITPDGKHIVFDRSRENSDIVLIDLPK